MFKSDYYLWLAYHRGLINRELTEKEYSEVRASEFAMHFLIPTKEIIRELGGCSNLVNMDILHDYNKMRKLAKRYHVPIEVMEIKFTYILNEIEKAKERRENASVIKRIKLKKQERALFGKL